MYEVTFNTCGNETLIRKSTTLQEFHAEYCEKTAREIDKGRWPQQGYFPTRRAACEAVGQWYGAERKRLLAIVRYCRRMETKYAVKERTDGKV